MPDLGQFLELSLPAPDPGASIDWWTRLGFTEIPVNDIRPAGYAAVTDGHLVLGLHRDALEEPALTFVRPDLGRHARALSAAGLEPEFQRLGPDQFNELGLRTPDGQLIQLLEAATFSAGDDDSPAPLLGRSALLRLGLAEPDPTRTFFATAGCIVSDEQDGAALITAPGLALALESRAGPPGLTLWFEPRADWQVALSARGFSARRAGPVWWLPSPEGLRLEIGIGT
jgi:hypothetical protein